MVFESSTVDENLLTIQRRGGTANHEVRLRLAVRYIQIFGKCTTLLFVYLVAYFLFWLQIFVVIVMVVLWCFVFKDTVCIL